MEYKYELHCHTNEVSQCGRVPAKEIVQMYKERGYSGIVITDHFSPLTFLQTNILFPQHSTDFYLNGYRLAREEATDDFSVLLGMELRYYATINDYLVYGVTEDFLYHCGNLLTRYPRRFFKIAHKNGMLVLQAHPCRDLIVKINPRYLDGAEVYNGKAHHPEENINAFKWAKECNMRIMVSGSDFHRHENLAMGGIITDTQIKTNDDLLNVLRSGNFERIETLIPSKA